ncbi:phosphonate metabolism protein/1,5-bisphosphokinase (PRPP-forming) PhnN [Rhizobium sp. BK068]|uniref:phosphonate metabolism protein/1,5-bisphosphokinase (PRPP-forming) PhnN n=1 Tax=Rhizobium sp. BK068 TaxID=2512130 RepID=UPI0010532416|nr:phosphonate metabolism protein/1,5-bisphosphokinase (PRPP-forming) PhnN [Rhizobium sp. BK068]TCM76710.1 ribose 1,5-bisphosphokinase [Rhizobium sp. BK068]
MEAPGRLVLVVGPSGAGKDTLIDYARDRLRTNPRSHFVQRIISRPAGVGEDHQPVCPQEFARMVDDGRFALHWQAHGLSYGIPSEIDGWLQRGDTVVANGSRAVLVDARRRYPQISIVNVTAPLGVLARRLVGRGRESLENVRQRLVRGAGHPVEGSDVIHVHNSGPLEIAGERLLEIITANLGRQ